MSLAEFKAPQFTATDLYGLVRQCADLVGALKAFFRPLMNDPMLGGQKVGQVSLTGGVDMTIAHKLGRVPTDSILSDFTAAATVFVQSRTDKTITLRASATCKANLWVK